MCIDEDIPGDMACVPDTYYLASKHYQAKLQQPTVMHLH